MRWQGKYGRKPTGGKLIPARGKRKYEIGREQSDTTFAAIRVKKIETKGGNQKMRMLREHYDALEEHDLGLYLSARIEDGLDRHDPRLALPGVVLARPVEGNRMFLQDSATLSGVTS